MKGNAMNLSTAMTRLLAAVALMTLGGGAFAQQAYPTRPIRLVAPFAPGGGTDLVSRLVAQKLTESFGQTVIVDNRPGGNTMIGTDAVAKANPDGHTLEIIASTHVLVPLFFKAPYDPIKDFAAVATIARSEFVLLVSPALPANNLKELIAYARSRSGELNYATPAAGGMNHLIHEMFNQLTNTRMRHVPYKGTGPAITALLGGEVQLHFSTSGPTVSYISSGRLKGLGVTGETRLAALPQVPTFIEAGLPGIAKLGSFYGIVAPAGTPRGVIDKISAAVSRHLAQRDFQEKLLGQALVPFTSTPEQFAALLKDRLALHADIIKKANIKLEN
jgi:tripartite-type tricarboxylate transporter receptor subunit TctC